MRTLLLAWGLIAAQAAVALAQAPPTRPTTAPTTQPAGPRPATQAAVPQPKPAPRVSPPTRPATLPQKPATAAVEREHAGPRLETPEASPPGAGGHGKPTLDFWSMVFVFMLATFIGLGVIRRVSRLLHTPLMSLTNAISAIAVVGSIVITGLDHPPIITILGAVALFSSMTNIVSGFLITDRMLKMFKSREGDKR